MVVALPVGSQLHKRTSKIPILRKFNFLKEEGATDSHTTNQPHVRGQVLADEEGVHRELSEWVGGRGYPRVTPCPACCTTNFSREYWSRQIYNVMTHVTSSTVPVRSNANILESKRQ